jgi:hypothetical protein
VKFLLALAVTATLLTAAGDTPTSPSAHDGATPINVREVGLPSLKVPYYSARGSFPQVSEPDNALTGVNATLRDAVVADEAAYIKLSRHEDQGVPTSELKAAPGLYETFKDDSLFSASTVVFSALIPTWEIAPAGTGGSDWFSVTALVPSGRGVSLGEVLSDDDSLFKTLPERAQERTVTGFCGLNTPIPQHLLVQLLEGLPPTGRLYQYFALTPDGLALGFSNGEAAPISCGRVEVLLPYEVVRPYLSVLGKTLVAGVMTPKWA